ncbi:hybrid sensor histidine kinase/response regulator [Luteitalea sp. TBR-22]|uniref:hybrid sensor histidine kinase/response regulator n=1 Tax=Luteitalea sp. TBR-22 TaxID=2802971 RepID=UPI001AF9E42B|nr:hybrid sensor histidine kinase/response regulator [Luteitalea sp. TBR-22]BCS34839.1 hybrid sensor histidine kinase/response regulator [Luteitalea sp. TBR-22]
MGRALRVLILEDEPADAELMVHALRRGEFLPEWSRVDTPETFLDALSPDLDVILADYSLPRFDGMAALAMVRARGLVVPFIVVSGSLGDERAVECVKAGATDYVLKDRLARLGQVVARALDDAARDAALRESQLRLRLATSVAGIGTWDWNLQTDEVIYSPEWQSQLGLLDEQVGTTPAEWESRLHPEDRERMRAAIRRASLAEGASIDEEYRLKHKDGTYRWIQTRGASLREGSAGQPRLLCCHVDVTARKQEFLEHQRLARTMQVLLDSVGEGVIGLDPHGRCTFINQSGARTLGWSFDEAIGQDVHALMHHAPADGASHAAEQCPIIATAASGTPCRSDDDVIWKRDGTAFPARYASNPIVDGGTARGAVVTFEDDTQRRLIEARVRQSQKLESMGRLTGGVAHDFNNLLTAILGYCELLMAKFAPDDARRSDVAEIRRAGEIAAGLTRQLLAFSRRQVLRPEVLDLNAIVSATERLLGRVIGENVRLHLRLDPEAGAIKADAHQIEQVLLNLAVNARDAMPHGGVLTLETAVEAWPTDEANPPEALGGTCAVLKVSDTGRGMSDDVLSHAFEPFFTTKGPGHGTGLGLATVLGIVEQSGGRIEVESHVDRGTSFTIRLPRVAPALRRDEPPVSTTVPSGHETILVVEDDEAIRLLVRTALEGAGYRVQAVASAEAALLLDETRADLLITDLLLPGLDGRQLGERLSRRSPGLRVLYMSGYSGSTLLDDQGLSPSEAFLGKPFTLRQLTETVRRVLDGPSAAPAGPHSFGDIA